MFRPDPSEGPGIPTFPPLRLSDLTLPPHLGTLLKWLAILVGIIVLFVFISIGRSIYTDLLWFQAVDFQSVYLKILTTRVWLFLIGTLGFGFFLSINLRLAYRFTSGESLIPLSLDVKTWLRRLFIAGSFIAIFILSLIFGSTASSHWETILRFSNYTSFNVIDPQFHRNASFYIFTMPVLSLIQGWLLSAIITVTLATGAMYYLRTVTRGLVFAITPQLRTHMAILGALLLFNIAFSYYLSIFQLVYSDDGAVFGAAYADIHAKIPALRILIIITVVSGILLLASSFFPNALRLVIGAFGLWIGAVIIVGNFYPSMVQRFQVLPNELELEKPYLERNIQATREGFALDDIKVTPFLAANQLDIDVIEANSGTINNIRLWDHRPLQSAYNRIQFFRTYYDFLDVDVDRYTFDGESRQVLLAARELSPEKLTSDAQTWINLRLKYTHGYGAAVSPVTEFTAEGLPEFFLKDLPPKGDLTLDRPEIYYGEKSANYVIVNTKEEEFDYPLGDSPVYTTYAGEGGVQLSSLLRKMAYAWEFGDINILISNALTTESHIQYHREIQDRVKMVAPFLRLDNDPYVVVADSALWWIQDAYTTTALYPYSNPMEKEFNYARNSVKVVISAYDGTMNFYAMDPEEPLLKNYRSIFPNLFLPIEQMSEFIKPHIRYPVDLFTWQAEAYLQYHMDNPVVFYNKEDEWSTPNEVFFLEDRSPMEPYYVTMKLPGEESEEFVLILPFTPYERENMVAWFAARNDGENYGKLLVFVFPRVSQVFGPEQIEARINNDAHIAAQFTLWQSTANVLRGNLLVIPIGDSLLYAEPVYLQAPNLEFPELKAVILADNTRVTMQSTLEEAIFALFGKSDTKYQSEMPSPETEADVVTLLKKRLQEMRQLLVNLQEQFADLQGTVDTIEIIQKEPIP